MKLMKTGVAAAMAVALTPAFADTLLVDYDFLGPTFDYGPINMVAPAATSLTASPFLVSNLTLGGSFVAYCAEPLQPLSAAAVTVGEFTYTSAAYTNPAVKALFNGYFGNSTSSGLEAAAFQFALWELVADTGANLSAGAFSMPLDPARTRAQQMLDGISPAAGDYVLTIWQSPGSQDLLTAVPVPEPATYAMMLLGLAGVGAMARRRKS